jgi:hypothetical protein
MILETPKDGIGDERDLENFAEAPESDFLEG